MRSAKGAVSVVIPTIGRDSLLAALDSVYSQTLPPFEVIVCNDSGGKLDLSEYSGARVLEVGPRGGGNNARIAGMKAASGDYIALLDDDDIWKPEHLEELHHLIAASPGNNEWIASSIGQLAGGSQYPVRRKKASESLSAYLFVLNGFSSASKGALSTSTLMFPKSLVEIVPWRYDLKFHQDLTWMLDVEKKFPDIGIRQGSVPTVVFGDTPGSVSKTIGIPQSIDWARSEILSDQHKTEFVDFLLTRYPLRAAASHGGVSDVLSVYKSALKVKCPSIYTHAFAAAFTARAIVTRSVAMFGRIVPFSLRNRLGN